MFKLKEKTYSILKIARHLMLLGTIPNTTKSLLNFRVCHFLKVSKYLSLTISQNSPNLKSKGEI